MPQALIPFIITVGGGFITYAAAAAIANIAFAAAFAYGATKYAKNKEKQAFRGRDVIIDANIRSATQPEVVIYGQTVVGSLINYANTQKVVGSTDNFELFFVDTLAGHEVEDIVDLYYDNTLLSDASHIDWGNNRVSAGDYYATTGGEYAVKVWKYLGTTTQTANADLVAAFADIDSNFRGRGIAYLIHRFTIFSGSKSLWESLGAPQVRRAFVKGKNDIYDPRLDTSPGANPSSATYQAWTDNPVLCIVDALRTYGQVTSDRIDWTSVEAEADICDELVDIPGPSTQKRYVLNGAFSLGNDFESVIQAMLTSCAGRLVKSSGKWRVLAGSFKASTVTLTEADIVGEVTEITNVSSSERYNSVRGTFINSADNYTEATFSPVSVPAFVTRDNGATLWRDINLPFTDDDYRAQNIAYKLALQSDKKLVLQVPVRWTGLQVTPGTTVTLSYGPYSSMTFRCVNWKMGGGDSPFILVLKNDDAAAWDDLEIGEYTTRSAAGAVTKGDLGNVVNLAPNQPSPPLINLTPARLGEFEDVDLFDLSPMSNTTLELDTSQKYIGSKSLKVTGPVTNGATWGFYLTYTTGSGTIADNAYIRANRRWILKCAIRPGSADSVGNDVDYKAGFRNGTNAAVLSAANNAMSSGSWNTPAFEIDLTAQSYTSGKLLVQATNDSLRSTAPYFWIDAIQFVDVTDSDWIDEDNTWTEHLPSSGSLYPSVGALRVKSADQTISGTSYVDDTHLQGWQLEPNTVYSVAMWFHMDTNTTSACDFQWTCDQTPQDSNALYYVAVPGGYYLDRDPATNGVQVASAAGTFTEYTCHVTGFIHTHATNVTNLKVQWKERVNSTNPIVQIGSWMHVEKQRVA